MSTPKTPQDIAKQLLDPKAFEEEQKRKEEAKKASANKKAMLEKQAKAVPVKQYYDVKVECMLPATLTYRILAENPQEAVELIKGKPPNGIQHRLHGRRDMVARVYNAGGNFLQFVKKLMGG